MNDVAEPTPVEVVALVASAGGLDALTTVLRDLPADLPTAVVVQQHLGGQGSTLASILERRTDRRVDWIDASARLTPGSVLICPPRMQVEVLPDGTFALTPTATTVRGAVHDALLTSLADSFGTRALAVVLTGMGRDGAGGTAALVAAGGVVIAQSEDTAEQPSMPRAAAEAGANLVLPLHEIGRVVADVVAGGELPRPRSEVEAVEALFAGAGSARAKLREIDWSATPLGPVSSWSDTLRTTVRSVLDNLFPMVVFWGPDYIQIGNDAIEPIGRAKELQGVSARVSWAEIWDLIGPQLEEIRRTGQPVWRENELVEPNRRGFFEEAYFTYCFSPIYEDAELAGVLTTAMETTPQVLAERRLATLRALTAAIARTHTAAQACEVAAATLAEDPHDVPFALVYLADATGHRATLAGVTGASAGTEMAPHVLDPRRGSSPWSVARVFETAEPLLVKDLGARLRGFRAGPWPEPPNAALLIPLRAPSEESPVGVLVAGLSPRLSMDEGYQGFLDLVAQQIAAGVAEARSRQRERERLERLAELDRAKTEFFSNVSHEFRTPLTLMLGPLEDVLGDDDRVPAELKEELELVRRNAQRLLRLVGTILDFSQIEAGRLRARFVPTDLAERTREIVAQFDGAVARAGLRLTVSLEALPEPVWVDPEMWEKIVSNLLSNALKFTFDGEIEVTLRTLPKHAELVIRDTGVGIPKEELPFVLKRFHRVRGTRARTYEGAGIGLALVDELVRRHHGRIRVTSEIGEGSAFTVWIPLGRRPGPADGAEPPALGTVAAALADEAIRWDVATALSHEVLPDVQQLPARAVGASVLAVDDNADMRDYLARLLGENWKVTVARDGAEALELARRDPPDLVVSDVMMPGVDGFELLRALRADERLASTPVVLVTARAGEEAAIEGLLAGADDYVIKPFSARELRVRVGAQLELARVRRRAAELNAFRVRLSDALRALSDPLEIQRTACRMLVEQLGADRARFVEVDEAGGALITMGGHAVDGMPGGFGRYPLDGYAPLARAILAGRRLVLEDTQSDPYVADIREALADLEIGAQLVLPLVEGTGADVALAVHHRTPRRWSDEDVAVAEEIAGRAWAEVERARAEAALRASEERFRALAQTSALGVGVSSADGKIVYTNRACEAILGYQEGELLGTPSGAVYFDPDERAWVADRLRLGPVTDHEVRFRRKDGTAVWVSINVAPIEFDGASAVLGTLQDVSVRKLAAERQRFLLALSDALRPLADPSEIKAAASRILGEQLGVNRAFYADVDGDDWLVSNAYEREVEHQAQGRHELRQFGQWIADGFRAGQRLVFGDLYADVRFDASHRAAHEGYQILAAVAVPLVKQGVLVGILVVHNARPRAWQDHELALIEETAERTWAAVERAGAEAALRASEERGAFLVRFSDAVRGIAEPQRVAETACWMIADRLGAQRAYWGEIDWAAREYVVDVVVPADDRAAYGGHYPVDGWEPFTSRYLAGETVVRENLTAFAHLPDEVSTSSVPRGHVASIGVPVLVEGRLRAILGVSQGVPRRWSHEDVALAEALAARAWAEVERARAEAALRDSEERLRMAVRATRMVTWEWVPSVNRITTSDSFPDVYGLPSLSRAEDGFALVLPEDRECHVDKVRRVAADGGSYLSEFRIRRRDDGRIVWLEERAEAQIGQDGTIERLRGVTLDISERKRNEEVLRETEARLADHERLRSMVNMPGVGVLIWERTQGTLLDANDAFLELSGYTRRQVESRRLTWRHMTAEEHVAESERQLEQLVRTGRIGPYEKDLIHADGSRTRMLYTGASMGEKTFIEYCIDLGVH